MLIPSLRVVIHLWMPSLSRRVNANSQQKMPGLDLIHKLIKKGEC